MHFQIFYAIFVGCWIGLNLASGQPSAIPPGDFRDCVIRENPAYEPASGTYDISWAWDGIHRVKATVTWTPPPFSHGFYSEHGWLGEKIPFYATTSLPERSTKEYTLHCGQSLTVWSDKITAMFKDPCAEPNSVGPLLRGGTWSSGDMTIKAENCSRPSDEEPTETDDPENSYGRIKEPYEEGKVLPPTPDKPFVPQICKPESHPDTRQAIKLPACTEIDLVSENILYQRRKIGFRAYNYDPESSAIPKYFIQETGRHSYSWPDGSLVRDGEASWTTRYCKSGGIIHTAWSGSPYWYGPRKGPNVTLTETTASGSMPVLHREDDLDISGSEVIMNFATILTDPYTTEMLIEDTIEYSWDFKGDGYYKRETPVALNFTDFKEEEFSLQKTKYKIRVPSNVPKPYKALWVEEFTPKDPNPNDDQKPEKTYAAKSEEINGDESSVYTIDPSKNSEKEGIWKVYLLPVEVAVDADRDGKITFDEKDKTTAEKPYRFWLNDDRDIEGQVDGDDWEEDDIWANTSANGDKDSERANLEVARDLEDITRLWINFSGVSQIFQLSDQSVKIKVRIDSGSTDRAKIILYQPVEIDGGRQYLKDEATGYNQLQGDYGKELCRVGSSSVDVPRRAWENLPSNKVMHLLFEGLNRGEGKIVFELWKDGGKICDLPSVDLLLKKATDMYETWTVGDVTAPGISSSSWPASSATQTSGLEIPAPEKPEEKDYIMFIHGWNMESWEKETFASTMFKRIWHQGYKGRFGAYKWPTFHSLPDYFDTSHFDASEERAWNSAAPLHALAASLAVTFKDSVGKSLVKLYAHSMGNVVASEALRQMKSNSSVDIYISAQAALSSHVWDNTTPDMTFFTPTTPNVYGYHWRSNPTSKPHQWQSEGRPSYMAPLNMPSSTVFINHYNPLDWALSYSRWQLNQSLKPDVGYGYDSVNPIDPNGKKGQFWESPAQVLAFPKNCFEIFAFAAESRAFATGQQGTTSGMFDITKSVNLNGASFQFGSAHKGHSAQFRATIQKRWAYWTQALDDMNTQTPSP